MAFDLSQNRTLSPRSFHGVVLMILGLALYTLSDAFIKHFSGYYSVFQVTFLRAVTRLIPLLLFLFSFKNPSAILKTDHTPRHLLRLAVNLIYTYAFMYAYSVKSLTDVYTLSYTSSFFMISLSALVLKESIEWKKWAAVIGGMVGVIVATKPNLNGFDATILIVLFGTFLGALNKILMRRLARTEHSLSITIYPNLMMIFITLPVILNTWEPMPWVHWGLFGFVGIIAAAGQYAIAQSLRYAQGSLLASLDYSTLFWALLFDYLWWKEMPSLSTLVGASIIVLANLYILYFTKRASSKELGKQAG